MTISRINGYNSVRRLNTKPVSAAAPAGWWLSGGIDPANCVAAYQPKGVADYATSKINLANPGTHNAYEGAAPSWDASIGWTFPGNKYLRTGIVPVNNQQWSVIARITNFQSNGSSSISVTIRNDANVAKIGIGFYLATSLYFFNGNNKSTGVPTFSNGIIAVAGTNGYLNTTLKVSDIASEVGTYVEEMYIGCRNYGGPSEYMKGDIVAFAVYSVDITNYITALNAAMAAL